MGHSPDAALAKASAECLEETIIIVLSCACSMELNHTSLSCTLCLPGRVVMQHSTDDTVEVFDPLTAAAAASAESLEEDEGSFSSSTSTSYR